MTPTDAITLKINSYMDTLNDAVKVPDFSITAGQDELNDLNRRVMSVSMTDNRGFEADQVVICVDDTDGEVQLPKRGTKLAVSMGWKGEALIYKGLYIVDEISHKGPPDRLDITASSADFRAEFNVKREVSWHDVTVERVVSAIAHRYGLKAQISEMLMDIEIDHADQTDESDMSFLTRMADMLGAIATVKNGSLLFILPGGGVTAGGKALPSFALTRSHGDRHRFRISDRQAYTGVKAYWLDLNFGKKRKSALNAAASPQRQKKRKAVAAKATTWKAQTATFTYYARPTRTKKPQSVQPPPNGSSYSAARRSFPLRWRVAVQISTPKCTAPCLALKPISITKTGSSPKRNTLSTRTASPHTLSWN